MSFTLRRSNRRDLVVSRSGGAVRSRPATWNSVRRTFEETGDADIQVTNELIEALARYEYTREGVPTPWSELPDETQDRYLDMACDTIEFLKGASR